MMMAGLLDSNDPAMARALFTTGASLLANTHGVPFGKALGTSLLGGMQAHDQYNRSAVEEQLRRAQIENFQSEAAQRRAQAAKWAADQERMRAAQQTLTSGLAAANTPGTSPDQSSWQNTYQAYGKLADQMTAMGMNEQATALRARAEEMRKFNTPVGFAPGTQMTSLTGGPPTMVPDPTKPYYDYRTGSVGILPGQQAALNSLNANDALVKGAGAMLSQTVSGEGPDGSPTTVSRAPEALRMLQQITQSGAPQQVTPGTNVAQPPAVASNVLLQGMTAKQKGEQAVSTDRSKAINAAFVDGPLKLVNERAVAAGDTISAMQTMRGIDANTSLGAGVKRALLGLVNALGLASEQNVKTLSSLETFSALATKQQLIEQMLLKGQTSNKDMGLMANIVPSILKSKMANEFLVDFMELLAHRQVFQQDYYTKHLEKGWAPSQITAGWEKWKIDNSIQNDPLMSRYFPASK